MKIMSALEEEEGGGIKWQIVSSVLLLLIEQKVQPLQALGTFKSSDTSLILATFCLNNLCLGTMVFDFFFLSGHLSKANVDCTFSFLLSLSTFSHFLPHSSDFHPFVISSKFRRKIPICNDKKNYFCTRYV